jgi:hypothetical protein
MFGQTASLRDSYGANKPKWARRNVQDGDMRETDATSFPIRGLGAQARAAQG